MAKHLTQITSKLKSYLHTDSHLQRSAKHTSKHLPLKHNPNQQKNQHNPNQQLPPALQLAILRGEALVRLRVFAYLANRGFDERFQLLAYQKIFTDSMVISEFCQQIGLIEVAEDYITQGAGVNADSYQAVCWQLYCILVDRLDGEDKYQLVNNATVGLTHHYLPSFFPKVGEIKPSLEQLKKRCQIGLNRHFHTKVRLKESFTCKDNSGEDNSCANSQEKKRKEQKSVNFRLLIHLPNCHPCEVAQVTANRTRSARLQAYHQLVDLLESGGFDIQPVTKTTKKRQAMRPLL